MKTRFLCPLALCLILMGLWPLVEAHATGAVEITNLRVEQRLGTPVVDIRYDVTAATPTVSVSLSVHDRADPSADPVPVSSANGHIGASVPVGPDRHIEWDAVADWGPWGFTSAMEFTLQAQPMGSVLVLSGDLDFGEVFVGETATRALTVQNTGNSPLTVTGISYPEGFSGDWSGEVAPGGSQTVIVTFTPEALQTYGGELTVGSDATAGDVTRSLAGQGMGAVIALSDDLAFGDLPFGDTATATFTIHNEGNLPLNVSGVDYPSGFSGDWSGSIPVGQSQEVTVTFSPLAAQAYGGTVTVHSDAVFGTPTLATSGTGTVTRILALSGDLDFGEVPVGLNATRTLTIQNSGNSPLTVTGITYPETFSGAWSGEVAAGGSQSVTVTFAPEALQTYSGELMVASDATAGDSAMAVGGVGVDPTPILLLSSDLGFGNVVIGRSATRLLTIQNIGNSPLTVTAISYPDGFSGDWNGEILAGDSKTVSVTFSPISEHNHSGEIVVTSNASSGTNTFAASGVGIPPIGLVLVEGGTLSTTDVLDGTKVATFYIGRYEVTWAEWQEVRAWATANGYDLDGLGFGCTENHPVSGVSYYDVLKWCNAKSEMEGMTPAYKVASPFETAIVYRAGEPSYRRIFQDPLANGYRLPLGSEWVFAASGGNQTSGYTYAGSNDLNAVGWYRDNSDGAECAVLDDRGSWPVGQKEPNELGLYDMSGNVHEWCWENNLDGLLVRGGSWNDSVIYGVTHARATRANSRHYAYGFRLARNLEPMVLVEGGTLSTSNELDGTEVETFYIGRHEVTWREWNAVRIWAEANGYDWPSSAGAGCVADHPVHTVNWFDALKWSNAKSEMEGLTPVYTVDGAVYRTGEPTHTTISQNLAANGYRLPLEAEWEFAARGGNQTNGFTYAGSNDLNDVGWYDGNSGGAACNLSSGRGTWPVGQKASNELGLYDMSGNVWEWCWDRRSDTSSIRRIRGGSWNDGASLASVSYQRASVPSLRSHSYGFRLARSSGQ